VGTRKGVTRTSSTSVPSFYADATAQSRSIHITLAAMKLRLFSTKALARDLATSEVPPEAQAVYLLASFVMFTVAYYSGLVVSGAPVWTLPSFLEALAIGAITVLGISNAFNAGGGRANKSFLVDFTCLYVPVSITTMLVVWGVYWCIRLAFPEVLTSLATRDWQFARNLATLGTDFFGLLTFLANLAVQAITYGRITQHMRTIWSIRGGG